MFSTDLTPIFEEIARLDMQASHSGVDRKENGITYTPPHVVRAMIEITAPQWNETIFEPSCGRGMFIFGLIEYWLRQGKTPTHISRWVQQHLFASDTDSDAIGDLQKIWRKFFQKLGVDHCPLNVRIGDGLAPTSQQFDIIIGNPPYVRIQNLPLSMRQQIRGQYVSCKSGNVDLYYAFIEDALSKARRVCYIAPNSWFSNKSALALRQQAKTRISKIVDFGATLIFAPVRAYTAIVLMEEPQTDAPVLVSDSIDAPIQWQTVDRDDARWSDTRWTPLIEKSSAAEDTLDAHAQLISGIATLADSAFTLKNPQVILVNGERYIQQQDPEFPEHTLCIPERFAPRLIKATKREQMEENGPRILCPYDAQWGIIDEATLSEQAPDLLQWLERRRAILDQRDKGNGKYEAWYAYGRRQGFWQCNPGEQVYLVPVMGNGALSCNLIDTAQMGGRFLFTSGYVLRALANTQLSEINACITSPKSWQHVEREGKAWAGDGDYRTIGARALRNLPWTP